MLRQHGCKAEINTLLAWGIALDVIGWFSLAIIHWPHELRQRDALKKAKARFPDGHELVSF
jgi:hypothetical protein